MIAVLFAGCVAHTDGAVCRVMSFGANGGYMSGVWLVDYANDMVHPPIPHASLLTTRAQTSSLAQT